MDNVPAAVAEAEHSEAGTTAACAAMGHSGKCCVFLADKCYTRKLSSSLMYGFVAQGYRNENH